MLYCLLMAEGYKLNVKDKSYQMNFNNIKDRYTTNDHVMSKSLPEGIIKNHDDGTMTFFSADIRHDVMYAFVTECLVEDSDLKFFLKTASRDVISEYCRSWKYKKSEGERCLYIPKEMYDLLVDSLQVDIITHRTMSDRGIHYNISDRCKYSYHGLPDCYCLTYC
jgi:hypothetical protein